MVFLQCILHQTSLLSTQFHDADDVCDDRGVSDDDGAYVGDAGSSHAKVTPFCE
jgi:hypothetical protein